MTRLVLGSGLYPPVEGCQIRTALGDAESTALLSLPHLNGYLSSSRPTAAHVPPRDVAVGVSVPVGLARPVETLE